MSLTAVQFVRIIATVIFTVTDKSAWDAEASVATYEMIISISTVYTHKLTPAWINIARYMSSVETRIKFYIDLFLVS